MRKIRKNSNEWKSLLSSDGWFSNKIGELNKPYDGSISDRNILTLTEENGNFVASSTGAYTYKKSSNPISSNGMQPKIEKVVDLDGNDMVFGDLKLSNMDINIRIVLEKLQYQTKVFDADIASIAETIYDVKIENGVPDLICYLIGNRDEDILDIFDGYSTNELNRLREVFKDYDKRFLIKENLKKSFDVELAKKQFSFNFLNYLMGNGVRFEPESEEIYQNLIVLAKSTNNGAEPSKYIEYNDIINRTSDNVVGYKTTFYNHKDTTAIWYSTTSFTDGMQPNADNRFITLVELFDFLNKDNTSVRKSYQEKTANILQRTGDTDIQSNVDTDTETEKLIVNIKPSIDNYGNKTYTIFVKETNKLVGVKKVFKNNTNPTTFDISHDELNIPYKETYSLIEFEEYYFSQLGTNINNNERIFNEDGAEFSTSGNLVVEAGNFGKLSIKDDTRDLVITGEKYVGECHVDINTNERTYIDKLDNVFNSLDEMENFLLSVSNEEFSTSRNLNFGGLVFHNEGNIYDVNEQSVIGTCTVDLITLVRTYTDLAGHSFESLDKMESHLNGGEENQQKLTIAEQNKITLTIDSEVVFEKEFTNPKISRLLMMEFVPNKNSLDGEFDEIAGSSFGVLYLDKKSDGSVTENHIFVKGIVFNEILGYFGEEPVYVGEVEDDSYKPTILEESLSGEYLVIDTNGQMYDGLLINNIINKKDLKSDVDDISVYVGKKQTDMNDVVKYITGKGIETATLDIFESFLDDKTTRHGTVILESYNELDVVEPTNNIICENENGEQNIGVRILNGDSFVYVITEVGHEFNNVELDSFQDFYCIYFDLNDVDTDYLKKKLKEKTSTNDEYTVDVNFSIDGVEIKNVTNVSEDDVEMTMRYFVPNRNTLTGEIDEATGKSYKVSVHTKKGSDYKTDNVRFLIKEDFNGLLNYFGGITRINPEPENGNIDEKSTSGLLTISTDSLFLKDGDLEYEIYNTKTKEVVGTRESVSRYAHIEDTYIDFDGNRFESIDEFETYITRNDVVVDDTALQSNIDKVKYFTDDASKTFIPSNEKVVIEDYPYGYSLRTTMTHELEFAPKKGYRIVTQTKNPKTGRLNAPKKSTYSSFIARYYNEDGHVKSRSFEINGATSINKISEFANNNFELFTSEEISYICMSILGNSKIDMKANVVYNGSKVEDLIPLYRKTVDACVAGVNSKGTKNVFSDIYLDEIAIGKTKPDGFSPFR